MQYYVEAVVCVWRMCKLYIYIIYNEIYYKKKVCNTLLSNDIFT